MSRRLKSTHKLLCVVMLNITRTSCPAARAGFDKPSFSGAGWLELLAISIGYRQYGKIKYFSINFFIVIRKDKILEYLLRSLYRPLSDPSRTKMMN